MICEICKINPVKVKIVKMQNGKKEEKNLCEKCAKKYENIEVKALKKKEENEVSNLLKDEKNLNSILDEMKDKVCETCGLDIKKFIDSGKIGCANCYVEFKDTIDFVIGKIQIKEDEIVKEIEKPKNAVNEKIAIENREIKKLKRQLAKKLKNEEFEEAATIRDKIKLIESKQEVEND